jgi:tetratricopeptide (TPR) repeat protein
MRPPQIKLVIVLFAGFFSYHLIAAPFIPSDDTVVASSNSTITANLTIDEINTLVINSQNVGQTERLQGLLKIRLASLYEQNPTPQVGYLYARVLQREHLFDAAINVATTVLTQNPSHSNSHLLLANIYMTKGQFVEAKEHCVSLIGQLSVITASTCVLDVQSQHDSLLESYQTLKKMTLNKETSLATKHVLSEMSYRLNNYNDALTHIKNVDLTKAPVSLIVLWADIQLGLNNTQLAIDTLGDLLSDKSNLEDAIILRLAIAEQKQNTPNNTLWQTRMKGRVKLRELRQDTFHASDLAKYYIEVEPNPQKALYWANINWQQAKMSTDQQLLIQAKAM